MLVLIFLAGIVCANLLAATYGPAITPYVAFVLIGLDLIVRDQLHDRWRRGLAWRMAALIVAGGVLSYIVNVNAGRIALASCLAFAAAAAADAVVYHAARRLPWLVRANLSNVPAAVIDSLVFLWIGFGVGALVLAPLQVLAKVGGGAVWSMVVVALWREA